MERFDQVRGLRLAAAGAVVLATSIGVLATAPAQAAAPGNDNLADSVAMSGASDCESGDNTDATAETSETNDFSGDVNSVWYSWTAPSTASATVRIFTRTLGDSTLAVSTGTDVATLTPVGSNDDTYGLASEVTFNADSGVTYNFRVAGYGSSHGTFAIALNGGCPAPANDDFADATDMSGDEGSLTDQTNEAATLESGEGADLESASVWYSWTPSFTDATSVCIDTSAAGSLAPVVAIYTGTWESLTEVTSTYGAQAQGCDQPENVLLFDATAATTYYVGVGGASGATGLFDLYWGGEVPPTVTIVPGTLQVSPTNSSPVIFDVAFSEPVTGFDETDVDLTNSTATTGTVLVSDTGDQTNYTVSVDVSADGYVDASIPADAAQDASSNGSSASVFSATVVYDTTDPVLGAVTTRIQGSKVTTRFSATDNLSSYSFMCHLDGASYQPCSSPFVVNTNAGPHTVYVLVTDGATNDTEDSASFTIKSKKIKP